MQNLLQILAVFLLFTACDDAPTSTADENDHIRLELEVESEEVTSLSDLEAKLIAFNISDEQVSYEFSSSCQHGFIIKKDDSVIFNSKKEIGCLTVITHLTLEPKESKEYQISLPFNEPLESGVYRMEAFLHTDDSPVTKTEFTVE